jgi:hypothetical protein
MFDRRVGETDQARSCMNSKSHLSFLFLVVAMALPSLAGPIPAGWSCSGNCGTSAASGSVPLSPWATPTFEWVSTASSTASAFLPINPPGGETNGSTLSTQSFTAPAGTVVTYGYDYVTSDGSAFDYGWGALYNSSGSVSALLFKISSASGIANNGAPTFAPLGTSSGTCYATGCGTTGWTTGTFTISATGSYFLRFGVTNTTDKLYDSALAIDGVGVGGKMLAVPEPGTFTFAALTLLLTAVLRKRYSSGCLCRSKCARSHTP